MPGKCIFNNLWLVHDQYKLWIAAVSEDKNKARCKICSKDFDIGKMGEAALKSHMKGNKHTQLMMVKYKSDGGIKMFLTNCTSPVAKSSLPSPATSLERAVLPSSSSIQVARNDVLDAEIRWAAKCITSHYSYNSCADINNLFQLMFPDSEIAKQFTCGPTKCAYIICFGIAPYCVSVLHNTLNAVENFTLFFDESLNKSLQSKQMDIHIRFWDSAAPQVETRYLTSVFLGHATAEDTLKAFQNATEKLDLKKIIQISMDGPAVNWKFFRMAQELILKEHNIEMLNVGSCGLHTVNNAFKLGNRETNWNLDSLFSSLFWTFKDSPARKEDFLKISKTKKLPRKFCSHRWLENLPVAERVLEIWDDIKNYVKEVEKKTFSKPTSKSYMTISELSDDNLICVKINVFISVTKLVVPFLTFYQRSMPLMPFIAEDLRKLVVDIVTTFNVIKKESLEALNSVHKLAKFDFNEKSNLSSVSKISLGFVGDRMIKELLFSKQISEKDAYHLKLECQTFIITMINSILEKSPLNFAIIRSFSCIDPRKLAANGYDCYSKIKIVISHLVKIHHVIESDCDDILREFNNFLSNIVVPNLSTFLAFDPSDVRLDSFLYNYLGEDKCYSKLWSVIKKILILSHGQADVERGFSYNKMVEIENLKEDSLIAQRTIIDHLKHAERSIEITKELRMSVANARQKYLAYLEDQKASKTREDEQRKRKCLFEELNELKDKKRRLENAIEGLENNSEKLAEKAEASGNIKYVYQSNSFRRTAKEKKNELKAIDENINKLLKNLKEK